jgi:hypothetical protein
MVTKTKEYWDRVKKSLSTLEVYTYKKTRTILSKNDLYKQYYGRAKNRTLIKDDPVLYKSVYKYTEELERVLKEQKMYSSGYNLRRRLQFIVENNCDLSTLRCSCKKKYSWTKYCRHCPDYKRYNLGRPASEETKQRCRISTLKYLEKVKGQIAPRYNLDSITIIEAYGKKHGYTFMHAENGGEYYVRDLGYFLDAYDPIKNVALEVDEAHHFDRNGNLLERDKVRQSQIEEALGCKFIRIKFK